MSDFFNLDLLKSVTTPGGNWYKCIQRLGVGDNSIVYLLLCTSGENKGQLFALKVFQKVSKPERLQLFLDEFEFLQLCDHPALVKVIESGSYESSSGRHPFVVAEYLPKMPFDVMRGGEARTAEKISYVLQLLSALTYLASRVPAVIHRDVKPKNIFVKGRSCILGDFGLMKLLDGKVEPDREIFKESLGPGMPFLYRTPDLIACAKGETDISTKSDVFQLGLVVAELFSGKIPARRPVDSLEPLVLDKIGQIPGSLGGPIAQQIKLMLTLEPSSRPNASPLLDPWQGIFERAADLAHAVDGRVI